MKFKEAGTCSRFTALALMALMTGFAARASILEPTATLPPPSGIYSLGLVCITPVCLVNANVSGFHNTSDVPDGSGNEVVDTTAVFSAEVFTNAGGSPGADLGPLSIAGTMDFIYTGRTLSTPLGAFSAQITDFDFAGTFSGHQFEVKLNPDPLHPSTGQTTINQAPGGYVVDSFFDVFAELSLNGDPFVTGPERTAPLTGVPEPGSAGFALVGLLGLVGIGSRTIRRIR